MSSEAWREIARRVEAACAASGLDLVRPFPVPAYNAAVEPAYRLPDFGRRAALGLVIANSGSLWGHFAAALRDDPRRADADEPLDRWVEGEMRRALAEVEARWELFAAPEPPPRRVALQRLAHVAGLAHLAPSHLCIHPLYGPWIGLRGAVAIDVDGPGTPPPAAPDRCATCVKPCLPALERALAASGEAARAEREPWRLWLAIRDACPIGREHRYGEAQLRYHYAKDRAVLEGLARGR